MVDDTQRTPIPSEDAFEEALGRVIADAIRLSGHNDPEIGAYCEVSKQAVGKWKRTGQISVRSMRRLERVLNLETGELIRLAEIAAAQLDPREREHQITMASKGSPRVRVVTDPAVIHLLDEYDALQTRERQAWFRSLGEIKGAAVKHKGRGDGKASVT